jgi:two-component system cell cycle response regulator
VGALLLDIREELGMRTSGSESPPVGPDTVDDDPERPRILIIEDERLARESLRELLTESGYDVTSAADGPSALRVLDAVNPDLIITDLAMPDMSGFEVIEAIRLQVARSEVPVIIVSAHDETQLRVRGFESGADDFVAKPIDFDELLARVRRQLQRARQRRVLKRQSAADELTGVLNRRGILELLARELERVSSEHGLGVLMLDLDGFKAVNDTHGHLVGDVVLCAVARELERIVRASDRVSRLGGDEFLVVMPDVSDAAVWALVDRIRARNPFTIPVSSALSLQVRLSLGPARARPGDTVSSLIERADQAMYADKQSATRGEPSHETR